MQAGSSARPSQGRGKPNAESNLAQAQQDTEVNRLSNTSSPDMFNMARNNSGVNSLAEIEMGIEGYVGYEDLDGVLEEYNETTERNSSGSDSEDEETSRSA